MPLVSESVTGDDLKIQFFPLLRPHQEFPKLGNSEHKSCFKQDTHSKRYEIVQAAIK